MIKCKGNVGTSLILILMRCLCFLHQQAPCENKTITNKKIKNEVKQTNVSACVVCTAVALQQALLPETFARVTQVSFSFSFNSLHVFFLFPLTKFIQLPNPPMVRCNTGLWASKAWLPLSISKRTHTHTKKKNRTASTGSELRRHRYRSRWCETPRQLLARKLRGRWTWKRVSATLKSFGHREASVLPSGNWSRWLILCHKRFNAPGTEFHTLAAQVDHESPGLQVEHGEGFVVKV